MKWISTKDRLPKFDLGLCLVWCPKKHGMFVCIWEKGKFLEWPPNCGCTDKDTCVYWMRLPLPPTTESVDIGNKSVEE